MTPTSHLPLLILLLSPLLITCHDSVSVESVETKPAAETGEPFTAEKPTVSAESEGNSPVNSGGGVSSLATGAGATDAAADHKDVSEITYDQRQTGTQNVRIHLDDVTLIVAPSEGIASMFGEQAQHAFIQNAEGGANAQGVAAASAQNGSIQGHSGTAADPYSEFDELISTANFLKSHGLSQKAGAAPAAGGKHKRCTGERCRARR